MKNTSTYLDKSVIYTFFGVFFLSASMFAFKYSKYAPCEDVSFKISTNNYTIGSLIKFEDQTEGANNWHWNFGDSTLTSTQQKPLHVYYKPGEYQVRLLVNGICEQSETITILQKKELLDSTKFPVFKIPKTIEVGTTLIVEDQTENASSWEWRFGETAEANAKTKLASYIYKEPGFKTISLIINGELKYISKQKIEVLPLKEEEENTFIDIPEKPSEPVWDIKEAPETTVIKDKPDTPKLVPYIGHEDFKEKLILVSKEKMSPNQFVDYFCGDVNKPIIVNGKNTTFLVFCEKIKDKKIKIKNFEIFRDKGSNCIKTITIDYKKSGLGLF
ncbi:PKD domain-containing protein [Oceanihabitans sp. 2_MG-2023]|uniref:PKD domain-containing protein n=1 Tax=Oceanihabitans sp. 2_MG-2023 TaxID=3062661 RepID=UPI0026E1C703|nr:PKD domain-containing protein [Oceanihabitans sp. 2_MG-2023]MDO6597325.1 PKD domain-containing protein [Oceanihabitans sp. 2_MG-2023]